MSDQNTLLLYGTDHCHLCELAEALVAEALGETGHAWDFKKVDISESEELFDRYGSMIPVLARPGKDELRWPFDAAALGAFLASHPP